MSANFFVLNGGVLVTKTPDANSWWRSNHTSPSLRNDDDILVVSPAVENNKTVLPWGDKNNFPQQILGASLNNSITPGLLNFKSNAILGNGLTTFEYKIEGKKKIKMPVIDSQLDDWLESLDITNYLVGASQDAAYFFNVFSEVIFSRDKKSIKGINRLDASNCRLSTDISSVFVYKNWDKIDTWTAANANWLFPKIEKNSTRFGGTMVYHSHNFFPGAKGYGVAPWIGSLNWVKMANEIPIYKWASVKQGFSLRYHIEMPNDYFTKLYPDSKINPDTGKNYTAEDRAKAEDLLKADMNKFLAGAENAGKAFYSKYAVGHDGKPLPGWKITPIEDKVNYDAYVQDFETSNEAIISSHGVDSSIASIQTNQPTGSDKRNAINILNQITLNTEKRIILGVLEWAKNYQFPDKKRLKFAFEGVELTTSDAVKSGKIENKIL